MLEAFRLGGWGMYPTTVAGVILLVTAIRYARSSDASSLPLIRHLSILTALVGTLGFVTGVIHAFTACGGAPANELPYYVVIGTGESLCNVALAMVMLVAARAATAIGAHRGRGTGAALVDPHPHV
jgi:hypothetical protein